MTRPIALSVLLSASVFASAGCIRDRPPPRDAHAPDTAERQAIQQVLDNYTLSVCTGDRALFESQLLDDKIPFYGIAGRLRPTFNPTTESVQKYAGFRKGVFESGAKLQQKFWDVKIDQDGDLAQVSLEFETLEVESASGVQGWKTIQLLKVGGHWKIASEFYTAYDVQRDAGAARPARST